MPRVNLVRLKNFIMTVRILAFYQVCCKHTSSRSDNATTNSIELMDSMVEMEQHAES